MQFFNRLLNEKFAYGYDAAQNLTSRTNNALVQTIGVNSLNELTAITRNSTSALTVTGTTSSNATSVTINGSAASRYGDYTFAKDGFTITNGINSFTAIASDSAGRHDTNTVTVNLPDSVGYTYDLNGNLLSDGTRAFDYDDENELIRVTVTNAWKSEFAYDGQLRMRVRKEFTWSGSAFVQTNEVHYVYDGKVVIQERDTNNLPLVTYTRGKDLSGKLQGAGGIGGLLARTDNGSGQTAFYHADGSGNINAMINAQQFLVAKYLYDPFGNLLSLSGPLADANLYRFSSKEYHQNSGLVCYLYRFYDPSQHRWINRDPLKERGGLNLYGFCGGDPINHVDTDGRQLLITPIMTAINLSGHAGDLFDLGLGTVIGGLDAGFGVQIHPPQTRPEYFGQQCGRNFVGLGSSILFWNGLGNMTIGGGGMGGSVIVEGLSGGSLSFPAGLTFAGSTALFIEGSIQTGLSAYFFYNFNHLGPLKPPPPSATTPAPEPAPAPGGGQQVFHVVNDAEKAAIQSSGKFEFLPNGSTPTGQPGKFFWGSMGEAKQFQQYWYRGGENSHIVSTTLSPSTTPILFPNTDGIGTAIWVSLEDLTGPIVHH